MEIADRQQLGLACGQPLAGRRTLALRAMPVTATIIADERVAACLALATRNVPSERRRSAALDGRHHLKLPEAHVAAIGFTPGSTVVAEDIRNLQSGTGHERRGLLGRLVLLAFLGQLIERAHHLGDQVGGDACVVRGRVEPLVAERTRAIMLTFYVIETQSDAETDRLLAGVARTFLRNAQRYPRP